MFLEASETDSKKSNYHATPQDLRRLGGQEESRYCLSISNHVVSSQEVLAHLRAQCYVIRSF